MMTANLIEIFQILLWNKAFQLSLMYIAHY